VGKQVDVEEEGRGLSGGGLVGSGGGEDISLGVAAGACLDLLEITPAEAPLAGGAGGSSGLGFLDLLKPSLAYPNLRLIADLLLALGTRGCFKASSYVGGASIILICESGRT